MKTAAAAMILAASLAATATSRADCGDPGQEPCTGPVPTIVTPGFSPVEAGTIDDHLNSLNGRGYIPFNFVVTDIEPAPDDFAGATMAASRDWPYYSIHPVPIVLISQ